ncbi:hypothetical protein LTR94_031307, partial [Friedmanniomyces endolithicus]
PGARPAVRRRTGRATRTRDAGAARPCLFARPRRRVLRAGCGDAGRRGDPRLGRSGRGDLCLRQPGGDGAGGRCGAARDPGRCAGGGDAGRAALLPRHLL